MPTNQEKQSSITQSNNFSSATMEDFGWLTKLNLIALIGFTLVFIVFEDAIRWVGTVGIFFCFILIFVLNFLIRQQKMISFQQRQIQALLGHQHTIQQEIVLLKNGFSQEFESEREKQSSDLFSDTQNTVENENSRKLADDSILIQTEYRNTSSNLEKENVLNEVVSPRIKTDGVNVDKAHEIKLIEEHVTQTSAQSSRDQINVTQKNQEISEQTLLKSLKGMTSLWGAFLEWFKGGNSIVRIAIIILLIGVVLLLRFASEYWQPTLSTKMAGIAVAGGALTAIGYRLREKRYGYAVSLQGAGLGILFLVLFSAFKLDVITSMTLSYGGLILLLTLTLLLALHQNALILAFIALGSGFIAPFILNTGSNNVPALFSYYLILNIALAVIAFFKPWRILNTVSLFATFGIGGLSIWLNAQPEQYTVLSILVWLHFALYLFVSIRYSQHIAQYKIAFKNIPLIDTALIFATPFIAFTLYAGLVDHHKTTLSFASTVLALVYLVTGYLLYRKTEKLNLLIQSFYGLGLTFLALILPFVFDAQWTSTGWAVQAVALIWIGCRHQLKNSVWFGKILLLLSTAFWLKNLIIDENLTVLAMSFLALAYIASAYVFVTPQLNVKPVTTDDIKGSEEVQFAYEVRERKEQTSWNNILTNGWKSCLLLLQVVVLIYALLVYSSNILSSNAIVMLILTVAMAVAAYRIFSIQHLSKYMQIFTACALFYFAMIPLALWQSDVISIWWTMQAFALVICMSIYGVPALRHFANVLLLGSVGILFSAIYEVDSLRYLAVVLFSVGAAVCAYFLWYCVKPNANVIDRIFACIHLGLSFLFMPYLFNKVIDHFTLEISSIALPFFLWWCLLTIIYKCKKSQLDQVWLILTCILLFVGATEITLLSIFTVNDLQLWEISSQYRSPMVITIVFWLGAFIFVIQEFKEQLTSYLSQGLVLIAILLIATLGGLLAWSELVFIPLVLFFPVIVLLASLKIQALEFVFDYWHKNLAVAGLGLVCLWFVSLGHTGQWSFLYISLLNPIDLLSFGIFFITLIVLKPWVEQQVRSTQIIAMVIVVLTGLMLISSVMLRALYHYMSLPYWSIEAWRNGTVQASLTILWVVCALILTTVASKKTLRHVWMFGIAVLALVIIKLIFLDLSQTHTITRIVSFIVVVWLCW